MEKIQMAIPRKKSGKILIQLYSLNHALLVPIITVSITKLFREWYPLKVPLSQDTVVIKDLIKQIFE